MLPLCCRCDDSIRLCHISSLKINKQDVLMSERMSRCWLFHPVYSLYAELSWLLYNASDSLFPFSDGPHLLELQNTVCAGVLGQVELIFLLQARWHKSASQEVISSFKQGGRFLWCSERDEHVRLESICATLLHIPTFNMKTNKKRLSLTSWNFCFLR